MAIRKLIWICCAFAGVACASFRARADDLPIVVFSDWNYYNERGWRALGNGRLDVAEFAFRKAIDTLKPYAKTEARLLARSYHDLAWTLQAEGRITDAEPLAKWALSVRERYPQNAKALAQNLNTLALIYMAERRYDDAEPLYRRAVPLWEVTIGAEHPGTAAAHHDLATVLSLKRKYDQAEEHFKRAIYIYEQLQNPARDAVAAGRRNRGPGRPGPGEPGYQRADPQSLAGSLIGLAKNYVAQSRYADAEPLLKRVLELYDSKAIAHDDLWLASALETYATLLRQTNRVPEAAPYEGRAKAIRANNKTP